MFVAGMWPSRPRLDAFRAGCAAEGDRAVCPEELRSDVACTGPALLTPPTLPAPEGRRSVAHRVSGGCAAKAMMVSPSGAKLDPWPGERVI